ncbi:hypothetical protein BPO_0804 [Bergeyella porcorum]|uniref:Rieske domain-containing protein n=1 Tax=Bergeyella porcorum TaxID=1735111 RepID=A0AAU0EZW9_9FLAO
MKKIKASLIISLFLIFSFLVNACAERDGTINCFPNQIINAQILLNGYPKLLTQQWDYTKGETGTSNRGLIIFFNGSSYTIYDRNAPHLCPDTNTTLEVIKDSDGFLKIYCPKDGAKWLLQNGHANNTQASGIPKRYRYQIDAMTNAMMVFN